MKFKLYSSLLIAKIDCIFLITEKLYCPKSLVRHHVVFHVNVFQVVDCNAHEPIQVHFALKRQ